MIYDYRLKDTANELTQTFDSLNGHELEQVSNFILQMKSEEAAERKHSRTEYIQNALTMILQNYAAETCSILEVHETLLSHAGTGGHVSPSISRLQRRE